MPTEAGYRTLDEIRAEAECTYEVFYISHLTGQLLQQHVIANDHEDAIKEMRKVVDCDEVRLVLKGDFLVLWMG